MAPSIPRNLRRRVVTGTTKRKRDETLGPPGGFTLGSTYLGGPLFTDAFSSKRAPSPWQLIEKYKSLIYALVDKNAHARSRIPLRLYADGSRGKRPRSLCDPIPVSNSIRRHLSGLEHTRVSPSSVDQVYEVRNHPILDALDKPDPYGYFDRAKFLNLISRYCDVVGSHWIMPEGNGWREEGATVKGPPYYLWVLYSQYVQPVRMAGSPLINYFQYFAEHIPFDYLVWFRANHSLRDPYGSGYSPTYAGDQYATLEDEFVAIQNQLLGLGPRPNMIVTAKDPLQPPGEIERKRFENELRERHSRGYAGGVLVANGAWDFTPVSYSPADIGQLKVSEYDLNRLCNIFGVPPSYFSTETNLANLQAADTQHARDAVEPWCVSVAGTLTNLVRSFDERLFFAFDPSVPEDEERKARIIDMQLKSGLITINQANEESQWPPAKWGDAPWISGSLKQPDMITESHETGLKAIENGVKEDGSGEGGGNRGGRNGRPDRGRDKSSDTSDDKGGDRSLARRATQQSAIDRRLDALLDKVERDLERYNPYRDPITGKFTSGPGGKGGGIVGPPKKGAGSAKRPRKPRGKAKNGHGSRKRGPKANLEPSGHFKPDKSKVSPGKSGLHNGSDGKSKAAAKTRVPHGSVKAGKSTHNGDGHKNGSGAANESKVVENPKPKWHPSDGPIYEGLSIRNRIARATHLDETVEKLSAHEDKLNSLEKSRMALGWEMSELKEQEKSGKLTKKEAKKKHDAIYKNYNRLVTDIQIERAAARETAAGIGVHPDLRTVEWSHSGIENLAPMMRMKRDTAMDWIESRVAQSVGPNPGGKALTWKSIPDGDESRSRAFYSGEIHMAASAETEVYVHEFGHQIEYHVPGVVKAAKEFLDIRVARDGHPQQFNKVLNDTKYGEHERGWRDEFHRAFGERDGWYVGKDYGRMATEIVSMGLQKMYSNPTGFARRDPEYFKFIAGILDGSLRKY